MSKHKNTVHRCHCESCAKHPKGRTALEHRAINNLLAGLDEKSRRQCVGALALRHGWGGVTALRAITGMSRKTIQRGREEILRPSEAEVPLSVRRSGGGRRTTEKNIRRS